MRFMVEWWLLGSMQGYGKSCTQVLKSKELCQHSTVVGDTGDIVQPSRWHGSLQFAFVSTILSLNWNPLCGPHEGQEDSCELWFRVCGSEVERPTAQVRRDAMCFSPDWSGSPFSHLYMTWESNIYYQGFALLWIFSQATDNTSAFLQEYLSFCLENSTEDLGPNTTSLWSLVTSREKNSSPCFSNII